MRHLKVWMILGLVELFYCCSMSGGELPKSLVELTVGREKVVGRIVAESDEQCWLYQRDGRMKWVRNRDVTDGVELSPSFKPLTVLDHRDALLSELGRDFEVKTTAHYVVAARRGTADRYGLLFERVYRQCHTYFGARGFQMVEPEFPLVAVVFPDHESFAKHCRSEGTTPRPGLVGFYLPLSNRVALYDRAESGQSAESDVDDTIVHEAVHQVAFNTGIHLRFGANPHWVVEGLATLMEAEGIRSRRSDSGANDRINMERLLWFRDYRSSRRSKGALASLVSKDDLFKSATLDAYSEAWALTFFLVETRSGEFAGYLKTLSEREPLAVYSPEERLADFKKAFGSDADELERSMLRFYDKLGN